MTDGREITAEEYLAHVAYAYAASPAHTPEESVAKALLELACARLGMDPQDLVRRVLAAEGSTRLVAPWHVGTGAPG